MTLNVEQVKIEITKATETFCILNNGYSKLRIVNCLVYWNLCFFLFSGTKIFKGEGRLNLSTQTLVFLNQAMKEQYHTNFGNENEMILTLDQKRKLNTVKDDIHFVTEVLVHTTSLKVCLACILS